MGVSHKEPMSVEQLANLTKGMGDWWDEVKTYREDLEFGHCDCCDWHPMRQREADRINSLLERLRLLGGGSPGCVANHCREEVFVEWAIDSKLEKVIRVSFMPGETADVMVTTPTTCEFWDLRGE